MVEKPLRPHIPYEKSLNEKARQLRNNLTPPERKFWKVIRTMPFFGQFSFNRQKPLGRYVVDFYCHQLGLVIDLDGDTHGADEAKLNDIKRTRWLEGQGLQVIRFSNREVLYATEGVMETVECFVEERQKEESP